MLIFTESFSPFGGFTVSNPKQTVNGTKHNGGVALATTSRTGPNWGSGGGTGAASINNANTFLVSIGSADQDSTLIMGAALYIPTAATFTEVPIFIFLSDSDATTHVTITIASDGKAKVYRGTTSGTLLATSASRVVPSLPGSPFLWFYWEAKVTLSDTVGSVELRVDESTVLTVSGVDTKNAGTLTVFDTVQIGISGSTLSYNCDDFYLCNVQGSANTSFLGAVRVVALLPNGNGATSNGVGNDGNSTDNYLLVNDANGNPGGSGGWVSLNFVDLQNTGDKDTYAFSNTSTGATVSSSVTVYGVSVWVNAEKTDTGTRNCKTIARLSSTEVQGTEISLFNAFVYTGGYIYEAKPGGGSWTVADVDAAEFGVIAT